MLVKVWNLVWKPTCGNTGKNSLYNSCIKKQNKNYTQDRTKWNAHDIKNKCVCMYVCVSACMHMCVCLCSVLLSFCRWTFYQVSPFGLSFFLFFFPGFSFLCFFSKFSSFWHELKCYSKDTHTKVKNRYLHYLFIVHLGVILLHLRNTLSFVI